MSIKLVTDSTTDLPPHLVGSNGITIAPISIQFGIDSYKEDVTITPSEFYNLVKQHKTLPKTSQPATGTLEQIYRTLATQADDIISIHISQKLSGTYQCARLAASNVTTNARVHVIDSKAGTGVVGWMLDEALEMIKLGKSADEIRKCIETKRDKATVFFGVDNLKYAQMSGRVSKLASVMSSVLNVKPIIGIDDGALYVADKVRSRKAALHRIIEMTKEKVKDTPVNIAVAHAMAPKRAELLLEMAGNKLNIKNAFLCDVAISIAVHFGPGTAGIVTYPAQ